MGIHGNDLLESSRGLNRGRNATGRARRREMNAEGSLSLVRTVTVGSGIAPDLLTSAPPKRNGALAGSPAQPGYRRWGFAPRPENRLTVSVGRFVVLSRAGAAQLPRGSTRRRRIPGNHGPEGIRERNRRSNSRFCGSVSVSSMR